MRRGLTLIEIRLAIALLGAISVVSATWLRMAATTALDVAPAVRWRAAAERTMRLIEDGVVVGDLDDENDERVTVEDGRLRIRTRSNGVVVWQEYQFDRLDRELTRIERPVRGGQATTAIVLDGVAEWTCELDAETGILSVTVESTSGQVMRRRFEVRP